ncbi:anti-sigma B factor RsbW [Paenibacillus lycopersici]|uniref:Anti-sigma B factor RsbW n=1 Tax=Paenibacillus lycopersici TaxID=2704462 RepID=A0A6C0FU56_9BACL|nr:anti-sigma B factor RsbW [Paenibacillus lycopersici]QHT59552.1 anti-sigma B factor RsbW [Paenibacillus lycopersici]
MNVPEEIITLQVPASAEYIDLVRLTLYGLAVKMGFSYEEIEDMKVAVSEACNNAVLYAYGDLNAGQAAQAPAQTPRIEVRLVKRYDALSIIVKDEGRSFDAAAAARRAQPVNGKTIDELQAGGLGLYLMQALMDDVEVNSEMGTEVVLTKRLVKSGEL